MAATKTKKAKRGQARKDAEAISGKSNRTEAYTYGDASKKGQKLLKKARAMPVKQGSWKPELDGDALCGKILARKDGIKSKHKNQEPYTVLTIQTDDGPIEFHCGSIALSDFIEQENPKPGQFIAAVFRGEKRTANGNRFKNYVVTIE